MTAENDIEFIRRKFTLPEDLDDDLEQMAKNHYQGNVSLCLRQAITDHRETLDGKGRLTLKRLSQTVIQMQEKIDELVRSVDRISEHVQEQPEETQSLDASVTVGAGDGEVNMHRIIEVLNEANAPLRVDDITERENLKPRVVRRVLGQLIDQGYVFEISGEIPRYQLAQVNSNSS